MPALTPNFSTYVPREYVEKVSAKQMAFLLCQAREAGYGGAVGGGKSFALLMDALQHIHIPGYAAILFRRTFSDLSKEGALMSYAHEWFQGTPAKWVDRDKKWIFPTEDRRRHASLSFGYMDTEKDRFNYLGAAYQYWGMDEATQFSERQYLFGHARLRKPVGMPVPLKMRSATNPGGPGMVWYKQRFIVEGVRSGRIFIPATLRDNPNVDAESYEAGLAEMDPVTREQYLKGNWDVVEGGGQFERQWFTQPDPSGVTHIRKEAPTLVKIVRAWDLAATKPNPAYPDPDWTVGALVGLDERSNYWILDIRKIRDTAGEVQSLVRATAEEDARRYPGCKTWIEQEIGASGKIVADNFRRTVLLGYDVGFQKPSGKKDVRARIVSSAAQQGMVYLKLGRWIGSFLDEIELFPLDGSHDDQVDAVSLAFQKLGRGQGDMHMGVEYGPAEQTKLWEQIKARRLLDMPLSPVGGSAMLIGREGEDEDDSNEDYQKSLRRGRRFNLMIGQ